MNRKAVLSTLLLIALTACNLGVALPGNGFSSGPTTDPQVLIGQAVSQTFEAHTQIARAVGQTMAALVTDTPERPSETPLPTFTNTPELPRVSVSVDTNCRWGPGQVYDYLGGLMVGEMDEIYARDPTGRYWYIRNLDAPGFCWIWGEYASVTGDTSVLPVYTPQPTPTPSPTPTSTTTPTTVPLAAFTVSYYGKSTCGATYLLKFQISNTGSVPWESISIFANDLTLSTSVPAIRDGFPIYSGCLSSANPDLAPGEVVVTASGILHSDPATHSFMAYVKICSQDGLTGTCNVKTIYFYP